MAVSRKEEAQMAGMGITDLETLLERGYKSVPFLNQKGERIGTAIISDDGMSARILVDKGREQEVLVDIQSRELSVGFTVTKERGPL
jgi:hypothetical protein